MKPAIPLRKGLSKANRSQHFLLKPLKPEGPLVRLMA
jgi:hypothetical protein